MKRFLVLGLCGVLASPALAACLSTPQDYPAGLSPRGLAVADFNNDGFADAAVADFGSSALLGRSGASTSGAISVFWGSANGLLTGPVLPLKGDAPRGLAAVDLGEGTELLATLYDSGRLAVYQPGPADTFGAPTYYPVGVHPVAVSGASFNGKTWVAVADFGSDTVHLFTASQGVLQSAGVLSGFGGPSDVKFYSTTKSKNLLLLVGDYSANNLSRVFLNPDGTVASETATALAGGPGKLAVGDLNGDGYPDAAVTCFSADTVNVFWGQADGSLGVSATAMGLLGSHPNGMAFGAVCGVPTFLVADRDSNALEFVQDQAGNLASTALSLASVPSGTSVSASTLGPVEVGVGAVTGPGGLDVLATEMGANQLVLLTATASGVSASARTAAILKGLSPTATVVVNAPGLLLAPNPASGQVQVFYQVSRTAPTKLLLYNLTGQKVREVDFGTVDTGSYQTALDLQGLGDGVYFALLLQSDAGGHEGVVARFKLAVVR